MIDTLLLLFLVVSAVAAIRTRDLLSAVIILTTYSLVMAAVWTRLNAVDVAFTEASVGAGITTVLLIAAITRTRRTEEQKTLTSHSIAGFVIVVLTGAVLVYGTLDMPDFKDPSAPANLHVAPRYIEKSHEETGSANFVTAVLASYRGYDTLGETTVIFTAGVCVVFLLRRLRER